MKLHHLALLLSAACSSSSGSNGALDAGTNEGAAGDGAPSLCPGGCDPGSECVDDGTGNHVCAPSCTMTGQCPAAKNCCTILPSLPRGHGVCFPFASLRGQQCLCSDEIECNSHCCAPIADDAGTPIGPYICKPFTYPAGPYECPMAGPTSNCVNQAGACAPGLCLISQYNSRSCICEEPCTNASQCGGGGAVCQPLNGTCNSATGSCVPPDGGP
jgi:hypothetical protein